MPQPAKSTAGPCLVACLLVAGNLSLLGVAVAVVMLVWRSV